MYYVDVCVCVFLLDVTRLEDGTLLLPFHVVSAASLSSSPQPQVIYDTSTGNMQRVFIFRHWRSDNLEHNFNKAQPVCVCVYVYSKTFESRYSVGSSKHTSKPWQHEFITFDYDTHTPGKCFVPGCAACESSAWCGREEVCVVLTDKMHFVCGMHT